MGAGSHPQAVFLCFLEFDTLHREIEERKKKREKKEKPEKGKGEGKRRKRKRDETKINKKELE